MFTRRSRANTVKIKKCTVVEKWTHGYFCLGYFSSSSLKKKNSDEMFVMGVVQHE